MKRILLTGGTGFVGGRLAEALVERGAEVVCPVRHWERASRLARLPVRMVGGDVESLASIQSAVRGCDLVVHCAVDFRATGNAHRRASALGTANVLRASLEAGVSRVIHMSSAAVHGLFPAADANPNEELPLHRTGQDYCDGKIDAERVVRRYQREKGLEVVVLRPTIVYGPFGYYSEAVARAAREGRLALVDGAPGHCNCCYIDNLIQAVLLALESPEAGGQTFFISDDRTISWREYLQAHASALGPGLAPLPTITRRELGAARRQLRARSLQLLLGSPTRAMTQLRNPLVRQGVQSVPGADQLGRLAKEVVTRLPKRLQALLHQMAAPGSADNGNPQPAVGLPRVLSSREEISFSVFRDVVFPIEKAKRLLGYRPSVGFEEGMARTGAWLRWARI